MFLVARSALLEFGGLQIQQSGPGLECARAPFRFDPLLALGEEDRFEEFESILQTRLYPLGDVWNGHSFLAIAEDGRVFLVGDDLFFAGNTIDEALERFILGLRRERVDTNMSE
jgi:hypothetical protein